MKHLVVAMSLLLPVLVQGCKHVVLHQTTNLNIILKEKADKPGGSQNLNDVLKEKADKPGGYQNLNDVLKEKADKPGGYQNLNDVLKKKAN